MLRAPVILLLILIVHVAGRTAAVCYPYKIDSYTYSVAAYKLWHPGATAADLVVDKPPGQAILTGWSYRALPGDPTRLTLVPVESAFLLGAYAVFFLIARRFHGSQAAWVLTFFFALAQNLYNALDFTTDGFNLNENYLALPMLAAVLAYLTVQRPIRRGITVGFFIGVALLIKQSAVGLLLALIVGEIVRGLFPTRSLDHSAGIVASRVAPSSSPLSKGGLQGGLSRLSKTSQSPATTGRIEENSNDRCENSARGYASLASVAVGVGLGMILVFAPVAWYLWSKGWLAIHLNGLLNRTSSHAAIPPWTWPRWYNISPLVPAFWMIALALAVRYGHWRGVRDDCDGSETDRHKASRGVLIFLSVWLLIELATLAAMRKPASHYYQQIIAPLVLLSGFGLTMFCDRVSRLDNATRAKVWRWAGGTTVVWVVLAAMPLFSATSSRVCTMDFDEEVREFAARVNAPTPPIPFERERGGE